MNRSFWNNVLSAKGKVLLGAAVVAMSAMLLFVVCGGGGGGSSKKDPECPATCPSGEYCDDDATGYKCVAIGSGCTEGQTLHTDGECYANSHCVVKGCSSGNCDPATGECIPGGCGAGQTLHNGMCYANNHCALPANACTGTQTCNQGTGACQGGTTGGDQYCQWSGDPDNCFVLNGTGETPDAASCIEKSGTVVPDCSDRSGSIEYCDWGPCVNPTADGYGCGSGGCFPITANDPTPCPAANRKPNKAACPNASLPPAEGGPAGGTTAAGYCRWTSGDCVAVTNPNEPHRGEDGELTSPPRTVKEACEAWGFWSQSPTCADYVPSTLTLYCNWNKAETAPPYSNCWAINNPNALKNDCTNQQGQSIPCPEGMTNLGGCQEWGESVIEILQGQPVPSGCQ